MINMLLAFVGEEDPIGYGSDEEIMARRLAAKRGASGMAMETMSREKTSSDAAQEERSAEHEFR